MGEWQPHMASPGGRVRAEDGWDHDQFNTDLRRLRLVPVSPKRGEVVNTSRGTT